MDERWMGRGWRMGGGMGEWGDGWMDGGMNGWGHGWRVDGWKMERYKIEAWVGEWMGQGRVDG